MNTGTNAALAALNQAIEIEIKGQRFYLEAAERTTNPKGAEMFRFAALWPSDWSMAPPTPFLCQPARVSARLVSRGASSGLCYRRLCGWRPGRVCSTLLVRCTGMITPLSSPSVIPRFRVKPVTIFLRYPRLIAP